MFDKHILIHTHIPKCGGGSINTGMAEIFGKNRVLIYKDNVFKRSKPELLSEDERANYWFYAGHFSFGDRDIPLFGRTPLYMATVRDPLSRLLSSYGWFTSNRRNSLHERMKGLTYDEAARVMIDMNHPSTRNSQCRSLSRSDTFEEARAHIEANYLALATCNSVGAVLGMFAQAFARPELEFAHRHARGAEKPTLRPETEALMRERTSEDAKLAAWVADHETEWLQRAKDWLIEQLEAQIQVAHREYMSGASALADARLHALDLREEPAEDPVGAAAYWTSTHSRTEGLKALLEIALQRRDFEQARDLYQRYRDAGRAPTAGDGLERRLESLRVSLLIEKAVAADLDNRPEDADVALGQVILGAGGQSDPLSAAAKALSEPADVDAVFNLAEMALRRRRLELAASLFHRFVQLAPQDTRVAHARSMEAKAEAERRIHKALKEVQAGRRAAAETLLKKALSYDPGAAFPDAYVQLRGGEPVEPMLDAMKHRTTVRALIRLLHAFEEGDLALQCELWAWNSGGRRGPRPAPPKLTLLQKAAALLRLPTWGARKAA